MNRLIAGASQIEITPKDSQFLCGYPHVERYSTGVHDPLLSSALYLSDGTNQVMFIGNDIIFVPKDLAARARKRIEEATGVSGSHIMITASHTHSGPSTVNYVSFECDPVVPDVDPHYVQFMEDQVVEAAIGAFRSAKDAELGLVMADATGVGTNRHAVDGPRDLNVPVLMVRGKESGAPIGCMLVCAMHPTVIHEDIKLVTGDFPSMARQYLQKKVLGTDCPVVYHAGTSGDQSPRHVTKGNTFEEAERLGVVLGSAVESVLPNIEYSDRITVGCRTVLIDDLPRKIFPSPAESQIRLDAVNQKMADLREQGAPSQEIRTVECDMFGAEEMLGLSKAVKTGRIEKACQSCLPVEIQLIEVGPWRFVGWQGECFVEYSLAVKEQSPDTFVISLANGEMQGYIATEEASEKGWYEGSNSVFSSEAGAIFVERTVDLLTEK